jgi:hypothetical protein
MGLAETITGAANAAGAIGVQAFPDLCSLRVPGTGTPDGFGGTTETETTVASGVRCLYEPLSKSMKTLGGAQITTQTHRITMEATTATTRAIRDHYKIVIASRLVPEMVFRNPVTLDGSFAPIVMVAAELIK